MEIDKRKIGNKMLLINGNFIIQMFLIKDKLKIRKICNKNVFN